MKISIITGIYPPDIGGPATFSKQMMNWLQNKKITSQVLTLKNKKTESELVNLVFMEHSRFLPIRILKSIPIILIKIIKNQVICTGLYEETGICIWIIKKIFKSKNINIARVVGDPIWERYSNKNLGNKAKINEFEIGYKYRLQRKILTWSLNQFSFIICPSEQLKILCKKWGVKSEIKVINNGFDPKKIEFENIEKKYDFITVSRIVPWKNLDLIIKKCIEIKASLLVVGDGPELNSMREKYQNSKIVSFAGRCDEYEVRLRLAQSRNYINASIYEGMSFSTLEALSTGMPIYVSNIPGNSQIINDFYVTKLDIEDEDEVSKIMFDGLVNQTQQELISIENVEIFNKLYSFNSMASKYLELITN
jgi:glycosyltransferase involved in cell wall biosynthesis